VREVTGPSGVDLVLDPQGTAMLSFDLELAAPGGRVILFGNASGSPLADPPSIATLMGKGIQLGGFSLAALMVTAPHLVSGTLRDVLGIDRERRPQADIVTILNLGGVRAAHDALSAGPDAASTW